MFKTENLKLFISLEVLDLYSDVPFVIHDDIGAKISKTRKNKPPDIRLNAPDM